MLGASHKLEATPEPQTPSRQEVRVGFLATSGLGGHQAETSDRDGVEALEATCWGRFPRFPAADPRLRHTAVCPLSGLPTATSEEAPVGTAKPGSSPGPSAEQGGSAQRRAELPRLQAVSAAGVSPAEKHLLLRLLLTGCPQPTSRISTGPNGE